MGREDRILDMRNMEKYLKQYDVFHQKYFWDIKESEIPYELARMALSLEEQQNCFQEKWTPLKAQDAFLTVRKVYDDKTVDYLGVLQLILEKFIGNFIDIEGMERLFKSSYFNFEWMMHLEYNPDRHDYTRYRDHYIHQIKNMYEMLVFLDNYGFMEYCMEAYQNKSNDISNAIKLSIRNQIYYADEKERSFFKEILQRKNKATDDSELLYERMQEHYYRYLLHTVAIISALIHDIGYPIAFTLRMAKGLHEFLPLSDNFLRLNDAMPHLEEILQESLLYRTTDSREIAERIKEHRDHGSISAVMLLSQYYETGAIYHLSPIKRMAVELSAVVVYNHTLKYEYMTGKKKDRYRNLFGENPISYLFRLCDDLQEWGRVYFDISKRSNFLICSRCHMPITRACLKSEEGERIYSCGCGDLAIRRTKVPYRKLTNIVACNALEIIDKSADNSQKHSMKIVMKYDLVSLLQLSLYSPRFAKQRADDMYEIKRMLEGQRELPNIYIDTFLSNNPIAIKVECLKQFLQEQKDDYVFDADDFVAVSLTKKTNGEFVKYALSELKSSFKKQKKICDRLRIETVVKELWSDNGLSVGKYKNLQGDNIYLYVWGRNLEFYSFMAFVGENVAELRRGGALSERDHAITFSKQLADAIADCYKIKDRPTRTLMMDYIWQNVRKVSFEEFCSAKAMEYYLEASLSTEYLINTVIEYVGSDAYDDVKKTLNADDYKDKARTTKSLEGIYDFYTDYELFAAMAQYHSLNDKDSK
jgi:hypothetical protein